VAQFEYNVERWRKPLIPVAEWVPVDFLLSWIAKESGGDPKSTTSLGEKGLFQMKPGPDDEQGFFKLSDVDFARLATDPLFSLREGVQQAKTYALNAKRLLKDAGVEWHGRDFWSLVKLHHNAFAMPKYSILAYQRTQGHGPENWDDLKDFAMGAASSGVDLVLENKALSSKLRSLTSKTFTNADVVGSVLPDLHPHTVATTQQWMRSHRIG
jgi:hypothetical protein